MSTIPSLFKISGGGNTSRPPASSTTSILPSTPRTRSVVAWACALATLLFITSATSVPRALAAAVEHGEHLHLGQRVAKTIGTRTGWPNWVTLMVISALPVVELRGGVPVGLWMGIPAAQTFLLACLGNLIPVPLILLVLRNTPWLMEKVTPVLEKKLKDTTGAKMNWQALAIFVGVPLPGTGAWTGAAIAALFKLSYAESFLGIVVGILSAAAIMTALVKAGMWGAIAVGGGLAVFFAAQQLGERNGKK
ncbi:hypothetical protein NSK_003701 [Nannochloropsis salina CCMP1776]|uniref:Small multi-drug export protein n=1 Tax=Nannochloropsis salina CCMP1776 TaxID=1027361 RepID=A0A4D9D9H5_9STRA|nr:hypothetical protein NSK_003701 [Nannochloropsis salina CCMP1776]|eukprot:TFJ85278.1 hypothetical protein NSK_003701 [Nannochloropsis salina CCMP1776]